MKLKSKLLLAAILLLLFPVATVKFLRSLDTWLVDRDRVYLQQRAQNLAAGLSPFVSSWSKTPSLKEYPLFPLRMVNEPILDGFNDEWNASPVNWVNFSQGSDRLLISKNAHYYFIFIQSPLVLKKNIKAKKIKYRLKFYHPEPSDSHQPPALIFQISPETQGKIQVYDNHKKWISRIQGYWRNQSNHASLELRIPRDIFLPELKINFIKNNKSISSPLIRIMQMGASQQQLLQNISLAEGEKLWLLGRDGEVLGVKGDLAQQAKIKTNTLLTWLIGSVPTDVKDPWSGSSQISKQWLSKAASEGVNSRIEPGANPNQKRIIAVARISQGNDIAGYILFEKVSGSSLLLSQPQVGRLINITLGIMILTIISLVIFSGRLAWRIERLKKQFSASLDRHGRVQKVLSASKDKDEIGQLSTEIKKILERQKNYQDYQERLASRLSHELRTPMAVVRGALDNLHPLISQQGNNQQTPIQREINTENTADTTHTESIDLIARATLGIERMSSLVRRMREAARLEQTINQMEKEPLDMDVLLQQTVAGLNDAWENRTIHYDTDINYAIAPIAAELIIQALEKLLSNAVDFSPVNSEIKVSLESEILQNQQYLLVSVINQGPQITENEAQHLFENMVSMREKENKSEPHLGLGLHIVHLVAKFHGGIARISNLPNGQGVKVSFSIRIK